MRMKNHTNLTGWKVVFWEWRSGKNNHNDLKFEQQPFGLSRHILPVHYQTFLRVKFGLYRLQDPSNIW